jgi:hypothetical protein
VGQQLEAQRYFNRLLCIEPNNDQVFELLQTIHSVVDVPKKMDAKIHTAWYIVPTLLAMALFSVISYNTKPSRDTTIVDASLQNATKSTERTETILKIEQTDQIDQKDSIPITVENASTTTEIEATSSTTLLHDATTSPVAQKEEAPPTSNDTPDNTILSLKNRTVVAESVGQKVPKVLPKISNSVVKQPTEMTESTAEQSTPEATPMGSVTISIPSSWADIWLDGRLMGRTGQVAAINLTAGVHELRLENPYSLPYTEQIEISAGQHKKMEITALQRKPAYVVFSPQLSPECVVLLDSKDVGELGVVNYKLTITEPNLPHEIRLDCPDQQLRQEIAQLAPGSTNPIRFN